MNKLVLIAVTPAALVLSATVLSLANGALPGSMGGMPPMTVPNDVARAAPSCGTCHTVAVSAAPAQVTVSPTQRSLDAGQGITFTTSVSGGVTGTFGGFVSDASAGRFAAGASVVTSPSGQYVSHRFSFIGRSWTYGYVAPLTPGLVEVYTAANTADGDGTSVNDKWGFHGDPTVQVSVPTRLFVNAAGVTHRGAGCAGTNGNVPVLGAAQSPTIGNASFGFELHGAAPSSVATLLLGANPAFQLDLTPIGVTGCTLFVQNLFDVSAPTSAGSAMRGDGSASWSLPIANNPFFVGFSFQVQAVILDPGSGRSIPVTLSNALTFTIS